jgi:hypothetical protein
MIWGGRLPLSASELLFSGSHCIFPEEPILKCEEIRSPGSESGAAIMQ